MRCFQCVSISVLIVSLAPMYASTHSVWLRCIRYACSFEKCFTYPQTIVYVANMYACKESFGIKVNIVNIQLFDRKESSKWLPHIYYVSTLFFVFFYVPFVFLEYNTFLIFLYFLHSLICCVRYIRKKKRKTICPVCNRSIEIVSCYWFS